MEQCEKMLIYMPYTSQVLNYFAFCHMNQYCLDNKILIPKVKQNKYKLFTS